MIQYKKSELKTIDVDIIAKGDYVKTLKAEQNDEQNNDYYIENKVETKETKEMI